MTTHTQSQIAAHASIIRAALCIAGVHARVHSDHNGIDVLVPAGNPTMRIAALVIAEVRRGPFPLHVIEEA